MGRVRRIGRLDLGANQLEGLKGLGGLQRVEELVLHHNKIVSDAGLEKIEIGRLLDLSDNRLRGVRALWANPALAQKQVAVFLRANPLDQGALRRLAQRQEGSQLLNWQH